VDGARAVERAVALAVRHVSRRERTEAEVRRHLEAKGVDVAATDAAVADLTETGLLDDAGYARRFAEDRRALDAWGAERIERRLREAGVAPEHIAAALGGHERDDERDAALALLRRRFPAPPETDRDRERALGVLVRRGYELELAYDAVRAYGGQADGEG
jgi:regulatory protein